MRYVYRNVSTTFGVCMCVSEYSGMTAVTMRKKTRTKTNEKLPMEWVETELRLVGTLFDNS